MTIPIAVRRTRPARVDAGMSYDPTDDTALLRLRAGKRLGFKREFAAGVVCDEDSEHALIGVALSDVMKGAWAIDAVILHYQAQRKMSDADALLLRYLAGGLRAVLATHGAAG